MDSTISEREHQLLLDSIKDHAIFMIDAEGYISSWNEGAKRLKGFEEDDVIGKHFRMLFLPEDRDGRPEQEMQEALETGRSEDEWWRIRKDGSRFWAHVILQPVFDEQGRHIGFAKITTDRTEQKRMDELNNFLMNEMAGYAIFLLDGDGRILKWSKAAESITGFSEAEVIGRSLSLFYLADDTIPIEEQIEEHLSAARRERYEDEGWKLRKDGSYFWASYILAPLHNRDGFVVMIRDLTDKKAFEQASKANIALDASNKELERFAYVVSHDLNEPFRKISILCHKLEANDPKQQQVIDRILASCNRASHLIDDILELASIAHTKVFMRQDLNLILLNVLESLQQQIEEKQASVRYQKLPTASVIPSQIEQLFQNLISNAIKFCCNHGQHPQIEIEGNIIAQEELDPGLLGHVVHAPYYLQIRVQDNGIGFDQKYSSNIFELFVRLHGKSEYEGTGVGLAICKKAAESHGGHITATSDPDRGTLFVVTIPYEMVE